MKLSKVMQRRLLAAAKFVLLFALSAGVTTCSFLLFFHYMELDEFAVRQSAPVTFFNIVFLSLIFTVFYEIYRQFAVERPVKRILKGIEYFMRGDFSIRIKKLRRHGDVNEFDNIIDGFNKMAEELSGVETLRTDFITNVSHELKTPLAVIQNYGVMLQAQSLDEERRIEYAKSITDASRRLANLITNILKLNRLENQQIFPDTKEYNLGRQLCECLIGFEDAWERKNLNIETDIDDNIIINADEELLSLVWNNLFSNAVKFNKEGGSIGVCLMRDGGCAVVEVSDTGCGISPKVGAHIFEKFYQGDNSHAAEGNGLGLALVKRVIDIIGGEISVNSVPGEGSVFSVRLKL